MDIIGKIRRGIKGIFVSYSRKVFVYFRYRQWKKAYKNGMIKPFTIISNNCVGGVIHHHFGARLDTPTVNLFFKPMSGYVYFVSHLKECLDCDIEDVTGDSPYPIGSIKGKVFIHFLHYHTFSEAVNAWNRRKMRMHWDNLFVIMTERYADMCTDEDIKKLIKEPLEYPAKRMVFVNEKEKEGPFSTYIDYHNSPALGDMTTRIGMWTDKRVFDQFDWVKFLSHEI